MKRLGLQEVQAENGRILCRGTLADAARLNLNLRCGARVLLVLGRFPARSFEELFQGTRAIAWEDYLPENAAFPVKGYSISSQLHSVPACQSIIKKAMVERMKAHYHREQFPEDGVKYQVRFSLFKDEAALCLDTSGEGLYKRGYRAVGVEAPLRETLAAAMVLLSRYRGKYDIWGGDIDPAAVELAKHNAALAGVDDCIRFEAADAGKFHRDSEYGQLVTNPPYGERLMEKREAEDLYRELGQVWQRLPEGWRTLVLSSHTEFERSFGRPAAKKRKLYNGMIKCDLFMYGNV